MTDAGVAVYSTGGTARALQEAGLTVHEVSAYTGFPEMMDGRLKTLHPKVFGGILGRRDRPDDMASLSEHGIVPFELVVVNLYPFEATIRTTRRDLEEAIEQIDIGGPSLVRAAAKNHAFVAIATHPGQYPAIHRGDRRHRRDVARPASASGGRCLRTHRGLRPGHCRLLRHPGIGKPLSAFPPPVVGAESDATLR